MLYLLIFLFLSTTSSLLGRTAEKDYILLELDNNPTSGILVDSTLKDLGYIGDYTQDTLYLDSLSLYSTVWLFLGNYPTQYPLDTVLVSTIKDYLELGGSLYVEGGECFKGPVYKSYKVLWDSLFGIDYYCTEDGFSNHNTSFDIEGDSNDFIQSVIGNSWNYTQEFYWLDELCPFDSASLGGEVAGYLKRIFSIDTIWYGVVYDQGSWRTVAHSFKLSGITGGSIEVESLISWIADFLFYVVNITEEKNSINNTYLKVYPNPSQGEFNIYLPTRQEAYPITLSLYDVTGRLAWRKRFHSSRYQMLDVDGMKEGLYLLLCRLGKENYKTKLLIFNKK